ncbi:MAG: SDR family oxidoreductase [Planctomycetes bacterium]|nr:SDR family oxidoreductase [Planctomycetota bacterium]
MDLRLGDKTVFVTGGSGGIGRALARAFGSEGARLILHARKNAARLRQWVAGEPFAERTTVVEADVASPGEVDRAFDEGLCAAGRIDACAVNAGIWPPARAPLHEMAPERVRAVIDVNLLGALWTCRAFLGALARTGPRADGDGAALILIGSTAGRFGERGHCEYAVSKAGLQGLLLTLKNEIVDLDPSGRVNLVEPGWTRTAMTEEPLGDDETLREVVATMPLRQIASADDIARLVAVIASPAVSRHLSGQVLTIAGGMEGRVRWKSEEIDVDEVRRRSEPPR